MRHIALLITIGLAGCSSVPSGPYSTARIEDRRPAEAERLTLEAAAILDSDPDEAERLLREALAADLYHGPAHNNLGVLFLERGELYEAASEFEWARKLMPGHPDPRMNLGLTLERAGRVDEAQQAYEAALEANEGDIETMQALARLQVRSGREGPEIRQLLSDVALRGTDDVWREWARRSLLTIQ